MGGRFDAARDPVGVFAWTQTRLMLPSWRALERSPPHQALENKGDDELRRDVGPWPFFQIHARPDRNGPRQGGRPASPRHYKGRWFLPDLHAPWSGSSREPCRGRRQRSSPSPDGANYSMTIPSSADRSTYGTRTSIRSTSCRWSCSIASVRLAMRTGCAMPFSSPSTALRPECGTPDKIGVGMNFRFCDPSVANCEIYPDPD